METKIEETVCFVCSYLYGNLPRSRVDMFAEELANSLAEKCDRQEKLEMHRLIAAAAKVVYICPEQVTRLLPKKRIKFGRKYTPNLVKILPPLEFCPDSGRFSVQSHLPKWTARDFCATRFGSTKLKTFPNETGREEACAQHPFTSPSQLAYIKLLVYLNLIILGQVLYEEEEESRPEE